jgi:hypothetical protein
MPQTVYLPIKLNDTLRNNRVGVFISDHANLTADINFIVYFHGHIIPACETEKAPFLAKGIEYYWETPFFKCLRDELDASKANAVLVAPALDWKLSESRGEASYGNLDADGKFDFLIDETLRRLKSSQALPTNARAGKIILAGHSAGGLPMLRILEARNSLKPNIAECWGFECLYWPTEGWNAWLAANPNKRFRHFRQPGAQSDRIEQLEDRANFIDVDDGTRHCTLVKEKWREAIDNSGPLRPTDAIA